MSFINNRVALDNYLEKYDVNHKKIKNELLEANTCLEIIIDIDKFKKRKHDFFPSLQIMKILIFLKGLRLISILITILDVRGHNIYHGGFYN